MNSFRRRLLLEGVTALAGAAILALFANAEQGLWYDPSQLDTMFQDSAGTTPVAGPGDPVGLILDKRLWRGQTREQAAIRQVTADFNSGVDSFAGGASGSVAAVSGELQLTTGATNSYAYRDIATTVGKWYRAKAKLRVISGSGGVFFRAATTGFANLVSHGSALAGVAPAIDVSVIYYATTSTSRFYIQQSGAGGNSVFALDDFALDEIPGNHASQATSASRPVLARVPFGGRRNLLTRTEEFDNAAWVKSQSTSTLPVVTANAGLDPDGNMFADRIDFGEIDNAADASVIYQDFTFTAADAGDWSGGLYLKAFAAGDVGKKLYVYFLDGPATLEAVTAVTLTNSYQLVTPTSNLGSGGSRRLSFGTLGANFAAGATSQAAVSVLAAQAQFEKGTTRTAYQKVTSTHDVTEAGKADCWHLSADGSDDFMATGNIDFTGTDKLFMLTGIRKDTTHQGMIAELSNDFNTGAGRFMVFIDNAIYSVATRNGVTVPGEGYAGYSTSSLYGGASASVLSAEFDLAGNSRATETPSFNVNGVDSRVANIGVYTDANPTFANQPIYLFRRGGTTLPAAVKCFGLVIRAGLVGSGRVPPEQYMAGKTGVSF